MHQISLPLNKTYRLFDIGVVDLNQDGYLDVFTSNHNYESDFLINEGNYDFSRKGASEIGLSQRPSYPELELSHVNVPRGQPGLNINWKKDFLALEYSPVDDLLISGHLEIYTTAEVAENQGFDIEKTVDRLGEKSYFTTIKFSASSTSRLSIKPALRAVPILLNVDNNFPMDRVYIGRKKSSPKAQNTDLSLQDRHGFAWSDINKDGVLDVFISRGGANGRLMFLPGNVKNLGKDEFLVSSRIHEYQDKTLTAGFQKRGCSGRFVNWLDANNDGLLDLFINCLDKGFTPDSPFPKQLYLQQQDGSFLESAKAANLAIPELQFRTQKWFDVDNDGDLDIVAVGDRFIWAGFNRNGYFEFKRITELQQDPVSAKSPERMANVWQFDSKISLADYDSDDDIDAFISFRDGNILLVNNNGKLEEIEEQKLGLPETSISADWVDFDNDGRQDLFIVPDGIYRQEKGGAFTETKILNFGSFRIQTALANWFDMDNNGRLDVLIAIDPYDLPFFEIPWPETWWEMIAFKNNADTGHWLQLDLAGDSENPQAIGASVSVTTQQGTQRQFVGMQDGSIFSQGHYRLYFGLGQDQEAKKLTIIWPDGTRTEMNKVSGDRRILIKKP